tara:strand:- start:11301 stop:11822 length:522 start_codon:yes stop_codon:yes gene_type:complete
MTDSDAKRKEFFAAMIGVGVPTLRDLYHEIISKVQNNKTRSDLLDEFNGKILPPLEAGGKRVMINKKTYYMRLLPVGNDYDLNKEMAKIPTNDMTEENKLLLNNERDVVISAPLNFNRVVWDNSKDFVVQLLEALPEDDIVRDIQLKLSEDTSKIFIYEDGIKFGLCVTEEQK